MRCPFAVHLFSQGIFVKKKRLWDFGIISNSEYYEELSNGSLLLTSEYKGILVSGVKQT